jgi:hypothetical protein
MHELFPGLLRFLLLSSPAHAYWIGLALADQLVTEGQFEPTPGLFRLSMGIFELFAVFGTINNAEAS